MLLGVITIIYFGILMILDKKKTQKEQKPEIGHFGPLRRIVGHPRRDVALLLCVGCLTATRSRFLNGHLTSTLPRSLATP